MATKIADPKIFDRLGITLEQLTKFCQHWQITEFALFGSILRDDFRSDSDIDILISFAPNHSWGLEFVQMREELAAYFKRPVDILTRQSIEHSRNPLRRQAILNSTQIIYEAR